MDGQSGIRYVNISLRPVDNPLLSWYHPAWCHRWYNLLSQTGFQVVFFLIIFFLKFFSLSVNWQTHNYGSTERRKSSSPMDLDWVPWWRWGPTTNTTTIF